MTLNDFLNKLPETDKPVVSIFSGGLDSTVMTYALVKKYGADKVHTLSFDYSQNHKIELWSASKTVMKLGIDSRTLNIDFLGEINRDFSNLASNSSIETPDGNEVLEEKQSTNYIANRNSVLINIAVSYAETIGAGFVFYGAQSNDYAGFWDCTPEFVDSLNKTFILNREHQIQVVAPFLGMWKEDEIKLGVELGVDFKDCWTCYNPKDGKPCKECLSCVERMDAFKKAGVVDEQYE